MTAPASPAKPHAWPSPPPNGSTRRCSAPATTQASPRIRAGIASTIPSGAAPGCGTSSPGLTDIGFDHPDTWPHGPRRETVTEVGRDRLTSDLCRYEDAHFVRCILPIPLNGTGTYICFGPWARVAREHFDTYARSTLPPHPPFDGCEAILANGLPGTDPDQPVPCTLLPGDHGSRPALFPHGGVLHAAQTGGISFNSLLEVYAVTGLNLRGCLEKEPDTAPEARLGAARKLILRRLSAHSRDGHRLRPPAPLACAACPCYPAAPPGVRCPARQATERQ